MFELKDRPNLEHTTQLSVRVPNTWKSILKKKETFAN